VNADLAIGVSFEKVVCIRLCEKLQGYRMQVEKEFALSFDGIRDKVVLEATHYFRYLSQSKETIPFCSCRHLLFVNVYVYEF
jgi:hypothetical protein